MKRLLLYLCVLHATGLHVFAQAELSIKMTTTTTPTITVTLTGPSGDYQIQRTSLLGNPTNWVAITNVTLSGSPFVFYDTTGGNSQQYYQTVQKLSPDNPNPQLLAWIPPGTFTMGSPEMDRYNYEVPQTQVTISQGFWMGRYEVTQKEYQAIMGSNPSYWRGDTLPVEQVSWSDATSYCERLTAQERAAGRLPAGYICRLPTEAEWEYACRAGTTTRFSFGHDPDYASLANYGWYKNNSDLQTHPVGLKLPNPWGLYDMHGNVFEWCLDWHSIPLPGGSVTDPKGPSSGLIRVSRGGNWYSLGEFCRSANRNGGFPGYGSKGTGFRTVLAHPIQ